MTAPYLIAGAHGGTGEALAKILKDKGKELILTSRDHRNLSHLEAAQTFSVDVTDPSSIKDALLNLDLKKGLSGFAYCIGSIDLKPFKSTKEEDFTACFELNVLGAIHMLQQLEAPLKDGKGRVVLFSTVAVQQGFANHSVIASAKGALEGLTRSLASEWAPHVRVNCIAPSLAETEIAKPFTSSEQIREQIQSMHALKRLGKAEDLAQTADFLLSEKSSWITGQVLHVDGGRSTLRTKE